MKLLKRRGLIPFLVVLGLGIALLGTPLFPSVQETVELITYEPPVANSETWQIIEGSIHDGDTFRASKLANGWQSDVGIRLCGIDAPELAQPLGTASRDYLKQLLAQAPRGQVQIVPVETDFYGRLVAEVFVVPEDEAEEEIHISSAMLMAGMAYVYPNYVDGCPNGNVMKRAEVIGQEAKLGVWSDKFQRPWEYRQLN